MLNTIDFLMYEKISSFHATKVMNIVPYFSEILLEVVLSFSRIIFLYVYQSPISSITSKNEMSQIESSILHSITQQYC